MSNVTASVAQNISIPIIPESDTYSCRQSPSRIYAHPISRESIQKAGTRPEHIDSNYCRIVNRPRMRVRHTCHECQRTCMRKESTCAGCGHERCKDCPRTNEGAQVLALKAAGTTNPSINAGIDNKDDGNHQRHNISVISAQFNAQLLEDHYQLFMRGWHSGRQAQDGDDTSSHSSSSGQSRPCKESLNPDFHSSKKNGKRCINETSGGDREHSEDDGDSNQKRIPKRPRKTAGEKQTELRCIELAAGRHTTAKCLTYSTKNLHRLKSVCPLQLEFKEIFSLKLSQAMPRQSLTSYRITS